MYKSISLLLLSLSTLAVTLVPKVSYAVPASATVFIVPSSGANTVGQDFTIDIRLDTGEQSAGAVQIEISYSDNLEFVSIDSTGSVLDQELISPDPVHNTFSFSRIRFDTGYNGRDGLLIQATFLPLSIGNATITINTINSKVIAYSDSTNILQTATNGTYSINAATNSSYAQIGGYYRNRFSLFQTKQETISSTNENKPITTVLTEQTAQPVTVDPPEEIPPERTPLEVETIQCLYALPESLPSRRGKLLLTNDDKDLVLKDVPVRAWYAHPIAEIVYAGIASGYRDALGNLTGKFGPNDPITYAELAKISLIARGKTLDIPSSSPRNQSAINHWSEMYIAAIEIQHISTFAADPDVDKKVPRGAAIQSILEALDIPIGLHAAHFNDVPANHPYSRAIATATTMGIIQGDTDEYGVLTGTFRPNEIINRAEIAQMVTKTIALVCE